MLKEENVFFCDERLQEENIFELQKVKSLLYLNNELS